MRLELRADGAELGVARLQQQRGFPSLALALCVGRSTERAWREAFPDVPVRLAPRELSVVDVILAIEEERA